MGRSRAGARTVRGVGAAGLAAVAAGLLAMPAGAGGCRQTAVLDLIARLPTAAVEAVDETRRPAQPVARREKRHLVIPCGTRLLLPMELPAAAELVTTDVVTRGSATARLEVTWRPESGPERLLTRDLSALPGRRVGVPGQLHERGRLCLTAHADRDDAPPGAAAVMIRPQLASGSAAAPAFARPARQTGPNLLVYLVDALRADRLGCYGYDRDTSPELDRFAAGSVLFTAAQAQTSWTRPAVASLLTGLWPQRHRAVDRDDVLPAAATTMAEVLARAGFATAAVIANGNVDAAYGFDQGFDYFKYVQQVRLGELPAPAAEVNHAVLAWLDQRPRERPFFLYVHTIDPHLPYDPPEPFRSRFAGSVGDPALGSVQTVNRLNDAKDQATPAVVAALSDLYDAEVAANDAAFGALLGELDRRELLASTIVVFLSDHGEELFDHRGFSHGNTLFAEVLEVPLVIRFPDRPEARRVDQVVEHVDLLPTLLEALGVAPPSPIQGESFLALCEGRPAAPWDERAVAHLDLRGRTATSYLDPSWKLILRHRDGTVVPALFDRRTDRREQRNLAAQRADVVELLRGRLEAVEAETGGGLDPSAPPAENSELLEQLKALGYL